MTKRLSSAYSSRSHNANFGSRTAWSGQGNVTLFARNKGIPPSVERILLKLNKAFRGFPPFLLTDLGRMVEPPVTQGLMGLPPGVEKKVALVGAGLSGMTAALELINMKYLITCYR